MEITKMNKVNGSGKVKAFFSLETPRMIINDMKLIEGKDGQLYAMTPSREYVAKDGSKKYQSVVYISDESLRDQITDLARKEYYRGQSSGLVAHDEPDIPF